MRLIDKFIFIFLFAGLFFISLNRHSRHPIFTYHSQIFADKAGYHIYFPAYFYYDMDAENLPDSIVQKTGTGFRLENKKIITKYPIGVAICQAPFSLIASLLDSFLGIDNNYGFTENHHLALNWATAIWGTIGLFLLLLSAVHYWNLSHMQSYMLVLGILFLSNLLYYTTRDCGMSHAYSFTVFAGIQYLLLKILHNQNIKNIDFILILILGSLLLVLRPLNSVFVIFPVSYILISKWSNFKKIVLDVNVWGWLLGFSLASIPVFLQLGYNYYAYGKPIADGYAGESFSNFGNLDLMKFWFSPNNGVLLHSPILLLVFLAVIKQWRNNRIIALYLVYFLVISFTYAGWWSPELGCGFGHRGFTEHLAFFALPISFILKSNSTNKLRIAQIFMLALAVLLFISQFNFDGCWQSDNAWDWELFMRSFKP